MSLSRAVELVGAFSRELHLRLLALVALLLFAFSPFLVIVLPMAFTGGILDWDEFEASTDDRAGTVAENRPDIEGELAAWREAFSLWEANRDWLVLDRLDGTTDVLRHILNLAHRPGKVAMASEHADLYRQWHQFISGLRRLRLAYETLPAEPAESVPPWGLQVLICEHEIHHALDLIEEYERWHATCVGDGH